MRYMKTIYVEDDGTGAMEFVDTALRVLARDPAIDFDLNWEEVKEECDAPFVVEKPSLN